MKKTLIKVDSVEKIYHMNKKQFKALESVTFDIQKGDCIGIAIILF